jgi:hypothetical protein
VRDVWWNLATLFAALVGCLAISRRIRAAGS